MRLEPTYPAPPVTITRLNRLAIRSVPCSWSFGGLLEAPSHVEIENGVAEREVRDLDEAVLVRTDVEVHVPGAAQVVARLEAGECDDAAAARARHLHGREDVGR